ncbi:L-threonylcarbamoyladenylate synthase [Orbaceae bacterium ac157xtp]
MTCMKVMDCTNHSLNMVFKELKAERPIIIPTDTNYNLACLPDSKKSIDLIFEYKERDKNKPLSLFFLNPNDWEKYGYTKNTNLIKLVVKEFWPGALNIIVENKTNYDYMLNGSDTIALGCIKNPVWRKFMQYIDSPIAITSANISGTADEMLITEDVAMSQMGDKVNFLLKNNVQINATKSSTIISLVKANKIEIIREGDITKEHLNDVIKREGYEIE